jgi:hypothetical protein
MRGTLRGPLSDAEVQAWWKQVNAEAMQKSKLRIFLHDPMNWVCAGCAGCVAMAAYAMWSLFS